MRHRSGTTRAPSGSSARRARARPRAFWHQRRRDATEGERCRDRENAALECYARDRESNPPGSCRLRWRSDCVGGLPTGRASRSDANNHHDNTNTFSGRVARNPRAACADRVAPVSPRLEPNDHSRGGRRALRGRGRRRSLASGFRRAHHACCGGCVHRSRGSRDRDGGVSVSRRRRRDERARARDVGALGERVCRAARFARATSAVA